MPSGSQNDLDVSKTDAPASKLSTIESLVEKTLQNVCAAMDIKRMIWKKEFVGWIAYLDTNHLPAPPTAVPVGGGVPNAYAAGLQSHAEVCDA
jgi:hypothetical protein